MGLRSIYYVRVETRRDETRGHDAKCIDGVEDWIAKRDYDMFPPFSVMTKTVCVCIEKWSMQSSALPLSWGGSVICTMVIYYVEFDTTFERLLIRIFSLPLSLFLSISFIPRPLLYQRDPMNTPVWSCALRRRSTTLTSSPSMIHSSLSITVSSYLYYHHGIQSGNDCLLKHIHLLLYISPQSPSFPH